MSAVDAPIRDLPTASQYQFAVAVLEWSTGFVFVLPPVTKLESLISHLPTPIQDMSNSEGGTRPERWGPRGV